MAELVDAMSTISRLQEAQMNDLIKGGEGLPRIDLALARARSAWERARAVYLDHLAEHGC